MTEKEVLAIPRIAIWLGAIELPDLAKWRAMKLKRGETVGELLDRWAGQLIDGTRFLSFEPKRIELFDAIKWMGLDSVVRELLELAARAGATGEVVVVGDDERPVRSTYTLTRRRVKHEGEDRVARSLLASALKKIWPRFGPWLAKHRALDGMGRCGYLDTTGKLAIEPTLDRAFEFSAGLGLVYHKKRRYQFIDARGKKAAGDYSVADPFREGLAPVGIWEGKQLCGYIDPRGRFKIKPRFEQAEAFVGGLARVRADSAERAIDTKGRFVGPPSQYRPILGEERAWIYKDDAYRCWRANGELAFDRKMASAGAFSEGLAAVCEVGAKKLSYVDRDGETKIRARFDEAHPFTGGRAIVQLGREYFVIEPGGKVVGGPWKQVDQIGGGRLGVRIGSRWGWASAVDGSIVIKPAFAAAKAFSDGRAAAEHPRTKYGGYVDEQGEWICPPIFDEVHPFGGGFGLVKLDGAYGYLDRAGSRVVPPRFSDAQIGFTDGHAWVKI